MTLNTKSNMTILVTGGTGFIGSHTVIELIQNGYKVIIVDNLINSKYEVIIRIAAITGQQPIFYEADVTNSLIFGNICALHNVDVIMHFAALKANNESIIKPFDYYYNNISSLFSVLNAVQLYNIRYLVFSSSATVYGYPLCNFPITENCKLNATTPYSQTKLISEYILADIVKVQKQLSVAILRYFNPAGAHNSGKIGEDPCGIPSNLIPYISQVAIGKIDYLNVFGNNYPTRDGTGIRDYIHVVDVARGHLAALAYLQKNNISFTINLGTGCGYSVLEVIAMFEKISGKCIPYKIVECRPGDTAICYADPTNANYILGWYPKYGLEHMCADQWKWQIYNLFNSI